MELQQVIDRLRDMSPDTPFKQGSEAGAKWAAEVATPDQLETLSKAIDLNAPEINLTDMIGAAPGGPYEHARQPEFFEGFIQGALGVFDLVRYLI